MPMEQQNRQKLQQAKEQGCYQGVEGVEEPREVPMSNKTRKDANEQQNQERLQQAKEQGCQQGATKQKEALMNKRTRKNNKRC